LMLRFLATIRKELLLLRRDWVGLLVLFVMPAVLVVVITLVQDNAMRIMGRNATEILFVNNDHGQIGSRIEAALEAVEGIKLIKTVHGQSADKAALLKALARGDFQVGLIIPMNMTTAVRMAARRSALEALSMQAQASPAGQPTVELELYFDPTVIGTFRSAVKSQLQLLDLRIEVEEKMAALAQLLPIKMRANLEKALSPMGIDLPVEATPHQVNLNWDRRPLLILHEVQAQSEKSAPIPDAVQQNVPAWSLFGIFFIVLPMAGSFIKERLCGAQYRMLSMPVSYLTIAAGKVCAYMLVCLVQFGLILCIGRWLLPVLGTAQFQIGAAPTATAAVALSAILAATGYGILLGTVVNSYEQASMFGPISVVIAAAIGGIMVPVYAMPPLMQKLSLISPLGWAQNAFLNLLVRGTGIDAVKGDIFGLLAFGIACIGIACLLFIRKHRQGRI
jgi:ABC-2 type transport system permease protein